MLELSRGGGVWYSDDAFESGDRVTNGLEGYRNLIKKFHRSQEEFITSTRASSVGSSQVSTVIFSVSTVQRLLEGLGRVKSGGNLKCPSLYPSILCKPSREMSNLIKVF